MDGLPSLWYEVKNKAGAKGWVPGSHLTFSPTAFSRSSFRTYDQYRDYVEMAVRAGEKVVAKRSYEYVKQGDVGYFVSFEDSYVGVVWEHNVGSELDSALLPKGFPSELIPFLYYVELPVIELLGEKTVTSFSSLAKTLPSRFPQADDFYAYEIDEPFPWFIPLEATYNYADEEYYDYDPNYIEGEESYGMIEVGSLVILGAHDEVNGGTNWNESMDHFVGKEAIVTSLEGEDPQGFLVVRVNSNSYAWRARNLALKGRGEAGSYGYKIGDRVTVDSHRYINDDNNWADEMWDYVGLSATITSFAGKDDSGSFLVNLDIDNGDWYWRVENLSPAQ